MLDKRPDEAPDETGDVGQLPHLSMRRQGVRPPVKPFSAKPLFKGKPMPLQDRTFTPQIPRRVADIPNPAAQRAAEAENEGKRFVVGKQIRLSGEITGCEKLVVEGQVDARLSEVKAIEVSPAGMFKGTAAVEQAIIAGAFDGTLTVGHLEIAATGSVSGTITYKTVAIANGGKLTGNITVTG
jgi:cytoskeletal protein CcmA (bactofilin family)